MLFSHPRPLLYLLALCGFVNIFIQCMGNPVAIIFSLPNGRKHQYLADNGLLRRRYLLNRCRSDEASCHVFVRRLLGTQQESNAQELHEKVTVQGKIHGFLFGNIIKIIVLWSSDGYSGFGAIGFTVPSVWNEGSLSAGSTTTKNSELLGIF